MLLGMGLLLFGLGSLLAARWIEDEVLAAGRSALDPSEDGWVHLKANGRVLIGEGAAPSTSAIGTVTNKLQKARGRTILGMYTAPHRIQPNFHLSTAKEACAPCSSTSSSGLAQHEPVPSSTPVFPSGIVNSNKKTAAANHFDGDKTTTEVVTNHSDKDKTTTEEMANPFDEDKTTIEEMANHFDGDDIAAEEMAKNFDGDTTVTEIVTNHFDGNKTNEGELGFFIRYDDGVIHLVGEVADEPAHNEVTRGVQKMLESENLSDIVRIDDQLTWSADSSGTDVKSWLTGIEALIHCQEGRLGPSISNPNRVELICTADEAGLQTIQNLSQGEAFNALLSPEQVHLLPAEQVDACDKAFRTILSQATIEFNTGSDALRLVSFPLLDSIANQAKNCPGQLRIEGHTDARGPSLFNLDLSQRRARSVAQALTERGLPSNRLQVVGYGETRPLITAGTPAALQKNRRIEIHVIRN